MAREARRERERGGRDAAVDADTEPFVVSKRRTRGHDALLAGSVNPKTKNLANLMRLKKRQGDKFVLMLGAGASMSSGVKSTPKLMEELLAQYGTDLNGTDRLEDRFDKLWGRTSDRDRRALLQPYLDHEPSVGYTKLAALIEAGYFDLALTFNFDDLVEKALAGIGFSDFKRVIRGETIEDEMQKLVDALEPRFKLIKLHGSLESSDHFLFDVNEMNEYPPAINTLVNRITSRDIVMCGYGFKDVCVIRAFAQRGGSVICVNPSGVPRELRGFLKDRRSDDLGIECDFDTFFGELHDELLAPAPTTTVEKPPPNPFKFLESYETTRRCVVRRPRRRDRPVQAGAGEDSAAARDHHRRPGEGGKDIARACRTDADSRSEHARRRVRSLPARVREDAAA